MATYKNSFLSNGFVGVLIGCVFEGQLVGPIEANLEDFCWDLSILIRLLITVKSRVLMRVTN